MPSVNRLNQQRYMLSREPGSAGSLTATPYEQLVDDALGLLTHGGMHRVVLRAVDHDLRRHYRPHRVAPLPTPTSGLPLRS